MICNGWEELLPIFNEINDGVLIVDDEFHIQGINNSGKKLIREPNVSIIGQKCHEALYNLDSCCKGCVLIHQNINPNLDKSDSEKVGITNCILIFTDDRSKEEDKGYFAVLLGVISMYSEPEPIIEVQEQRMPMIYSESNMSVPFGYVTQMEELQALFSEIQDLNSKLPKGEKILDQTISLIQEMQNLWNEQRKLRAKFIFQAVFLDEVTDMVVVTDLHGYISYVNKAHIRLMGNQSDELIGKPYLWWAKNMEFGIPFSEIIVNTMRDGNWQGEIIYQIPKGTDMIVNRRTQLIRDENNKPVGIICFNSDVTLTKKLEHEINIKNKDLAHKGDELKILKDRAEQSDKLKNAFLANISHEVRTPMNGIVGFSKLLQEKGLSGEQRTNYGNLVNQCCDRLLSVIEDIIDISKLETGEIKIIYENVIVHEMVNDLFLGFQPKIEEKPIEFIRCCPSDDNYRIIRTDKLRLQQILNILLNNALKFTQSGFIKIGYDLVDENTLQFYVSDSGIGIEPEMHELIFDSFRQVNSHLSNFYGGLGLGLSISKKLTELLGGKIRLISVPNQGSTFYLSFPYVPSSTHYNLSSLRITAK